MLDVFATCFEELPEEAESEDASRTQRGRSRRGKMMIREAAAATATSRRDDVASVTLMGMSTPAGCWLQT